MVCDRGSNVSLEGDGREHDLVIKNPCQGKVVSRPTMALTVGRWYPTDVQMSRRSLDCCLRSALSVRFYQFIISPFVQTWS